MKKTEGRFSTGVSRDDIVKAVFDNDCNSIAEMLEEFRFAKDDTPPHFLNSSSLLAVQMLTAASMAASRETLTDETANTIIQYICHNMNLFTFLWQIKAYLKNEATEYNKLPEKIITQLKSDEYVDFDDEIAKLNKEQTEILINFILSEIKTIHKSFGPPIVKKLRELVPDCLLFGLVATNLTDPMPDSMLGIVRILGAFGHYDEEEDEDDADGTCDESCSEGGRCGKCGECENN